MSDKKIKMNMIPEKTFRWVKVNEYIFDQPIDFQKRSYKKEYLDMTTGLEEPSSGEIASDEATSNESTSDETAFGGTSFLRVANSEEITSGEASSCETTSGETAVRIHKTGDVNEDKLARYSSKFDDGKAGMAGIAEEIQLESENNYNSGLFLEIPEDTHIKDPIKISYLLDKENPLVVDKSIIYARENSSATIIIDVAPSEDSNKDLSEGLNVSSLRYNGNMRILAEKNSSIKLIKIQRLRDQDVYFSFAYADTKPGALVDVVDVQLGSKAAVVNYMWDIYENGRGVINGVYLGDGSRHLELAYQMNHIGKNSYSDMDIRGALKDRSTKMFKGTLDFKQGASGADGRELEDVMLFSDKAKSISVPLLLSAEDNVQGQHAVSTGRVDSDKLFYLMSRGLSEGESVNLLVEGSFSHALDKIYDQDIKNQVKGEIHRRLVGEVK